MDKQIAFTIELVPAGKGFKAKSLLMNEEVFVDIETLHEIIAFAEEKTAIFYQEIKGLSSKYHSDVMTLCWPNTAQKEYIIGLTISNKE